MNKILIIDNSPGFTGAFNSIVQSTTKLMQEYDFIYIVPKRSKNTELLGNSNIKFQTYSFIEISKSINTLFYIPNLIYNALKLKKYINRHNIDIVHFNDLYNMLGVCLKLLNTNAKIIYHIRLLPSSYVGKLYSIWKKLIEKYADGIICVSEAVAKNFNKTKTVIIYDSIAILPRLSTRKKDPIKEPLTILYLANYITGKGHIQAIQAYKKAIPELKNTRLVFYGGTLERKKNQRFKEYLEQYSKKLGLENHVVFNGFSTSPARTISAADMMLNFSESESFSMTTLEAISYGTPIIATDCGGPAEIIENDVSGIIVPVNDISAMVYQMIRLMKDSNLRNEFKNNGVKRVNAKFNIDDQVDKLRKIYSRLLKN